MYNVYRYIDIDGTEVIFEPDEEKNLRAISSPGTNLNIDLHELVAVIAEELQQLLHNYCPYKIVLKKRRM